MRRIKRYFVICVFALTMLALFASVMWFNNFQSSQDNYSVQLASLIDSEWGSYSSNFSGFGGGIAMFISSPKGDYFVSANMGNVTADIHFRAASTTKTFTGAAILLLQQQGKLQINDKITNNIPGTDVPYVPSSNEYAIPYKDEITIKQLLEHRAGVFDVSNSPIPENVSAPYAGQYYLDYIKENQSQPEHTFTFDELVNVVASNNLSYSPPGTSFHYSNTGCSILGKIIERVSGMSYAAFMEQYFLGPSILSETFFPDEGSDRNIPFPFAEGYVWSQGSLYDATIENMSPHVAEGNLITTPNNLARWVRLLYSGHTGVNQTYINQMMDVKSTGEEHGVYGLCTTYNDGLGYGHNGAHAGYLTVMRYDPTNDVAIVIFTTGFNADDLYQELYFVYDLGHSAKKILGYDN